MKSGNLPMVTLGKVPIPAANAPRDEGLRQIFSPTSLRCRDFLLRIDSFYFYKKERNGKNGELSFYFGVRNRGTSR